MFTELQAQRDQRIDLCRAARRQIAKRNPDDGGKDDGEGNNQRIEDERNAEQARRHHRAGEAAGETAGPPERADQGPGHRGGERLVGAHIELGLSIEPGLPRVRIPPSGVEEIIMNLVLNARDAMPKGGSLTIAVYSRPGGAEGSPPGGAGGSAPEHSDALRVVLDGRARSPVNARVFDDRAPSLLMVAPGAVVDMHREAKIDTVEIPTGHDGHLDVDAALGVLWRREVRSVLVEGGPTVTTAFVAGDTGLVLNNFLYWTDLDPASPNVMAPRKPRESAMSPCIVSENAPEMTAWDAITVAIAVRITSGTSDQRGAIRKNGFSAAAGSWSSSAPCPK